MLSTSSASRSTSKLVVIPRLVVNTYRPAALQKLVGVSILTFRMDSRPVVWEASNLSHIEQDHPERGIVQAEVAEALNDPDRIESIEKRHGVTYHTVIGRTSKGRLLVVAWVDHSSGRFPVHARQAGRRAARRYYE